MKIVKLTGVIGAELLDVDISRDLSSQKISDIRQALLENKVILFRGQQLSPEQHIAFTEKFGEISRSPVYQTLPTHPQIMPVVKEPKDKDVIGDTWHTDETYQSAPPMGSLLYARHVPEVSVETVVGVLSHGAGVEDDHIGVGEFARGLGCGNQTGLFE